MVKGKRKSLEQLKEILQPYGKTLIIGCGGCVVKCDEQKAISFKPRKIHKPPVDNIVEFWVRRNFQLKGREEDFVPKLTLGATRALARINPVHITGPRARGWTK